MMNKINVTFLITIIVIMFMEQLFSQSHNVNKETLAQLKTFRTDYIESFQKENSEILFKYYADNIRLMPAFQKTIFGRENTLDYYAEFTNRFSVKAFERNSIEILDLGKQVMEIGNLKMQLILKENDKKYELEGVYLSLWQKEENGKLSLITDAWNYDAYYEGIDSLLRFDKVQAEIVAFRPHVVVNNPISFELAAYCRLLDVAVTQHDANIWSQFFAEDAMLIPNYHAPFRGKKDIDKYIQMHVEELPVFEELDIRNDRIDNLGDYIIEYASHVANWRSGEYSGVNTGKNIRIWRRQPDHSLKIFRSISMYD